MERAAHANRSLDDFDYQWQRLHDQAAELTKLAQLAAEPVTDEVVGFPARLMNADKDQRTLAWLGIEDIDAMMQPGLTALHTVTARGQNASVPALALWREFHAARASLLALAPPASGPDDQPGLDKAA